ncbi:MAG: hypothetical protein GY850_09010 [bacterium]|nr:hypothetical protein [bacterium]
MNKFVELTTFFRLPHSLAQNVQSVWFAGSITENCDPIGENRTRRARAGRPPTSSILSSVPDT